MPDLGRPTEAAFSRMVAAIYDAATSPVQWNDALQLLRETFGLTFAASIVRNTDRSRVRGTVSGVGNDGYHPAVDFQRAAEGL